MRLAIFLGLSSVCCAVALAQSATFARTDYPGVGNNQIAADFNGDGKMDIAGLAQNSIAVMLGAGDGTLGPRTHYSVGGQLQDLAAGDFTSDGKLDLVITKADLQTTMSLLTGNGDGTFNAPIDFPNITGFDAPAVIAADLNNDTWLDVVIAHQIACFTAPCRVSETLAVMLGNGNGTFQATRLIQVGRGMAEIAVGDFNRDGVKDLAIAGDSSRLYLLIGVGDGSFVQQPTITMTADTLGVDGTDVDAADLNRDGILDLSVVIGLNGSRIAILIGNGDGTFRQPSILTDPGTRIPQSQAVADYNGDGFVDLALGMGWGLQGWMSIWNGNGDGTFRNPVMYLVPGAQSSTSGGRVITEDFNNDRKPDIALHFLGASNGLVMLRNTTGAVPPPVPSAPTLLSPATDATVPQPVTLDWSDVGAASTYTIQIDDSNNFGSPFVVNTNVNISRFTAGTLPLRRLWWRVRGINSAGAAGPWSAARTFTPQAAPSGPPALSALTISPSSVVGGATAQGTVTLTSAAPSGGAVIALTSSNPSVASVPSSINIAAGSLSATFAIATVSVTSSTSVTITSAYGGVTRTAPLNVTTAASTDTVAVQRAEYSNGQLRLEATSTSSAATLRVYVTSTNVQIGTLRNEGGGRYRGEFSWPSNPQNITIRSSLGGSASRAVTAK